MQSTHSHFSAVFLVINMEVAKIATSFLTFQSTCLHSDSFVYRYSTWRGSGP